MQTLLNAHNLMQLQGDRHDFLKFVHDVIMQLLAYAPRMNHSGSCYSVEACLDNVARLAGRNHFPTKHVYEENAGVSSRTSMSKKCRVCYSVLHVDTVLPRARLSKRLGCATVRGLYNCTWQRTRLLNCFYCSFYCLFYLIHFDHLICFYVLYFL